MQSLFLWILKEKLSICYCEKILQLVYKIVNNVNCPDQLKNYLVKRSQLRQRPLRHPTLLDSGDTMSSGLGQLC